MLQERIPNDFYKLFRTKNMEQYMTILVTLYEENCKDYTTFGLTEEQCKILIAEVIAKEKMTWSMEDADISEEGMFDYSPAQIWRRLVLWGWIKSEYDERINSNLCVFPEYSQMYVELFEKLQCDEESQERESMLNIYSALFTYQADGERNIEMLRSALQTSRRLGQMLANMQDGMRGYFEELSGQRDFLGVQAVLVSEINNKDSKKYAILTTTDSFYRYKEAVKELVSELLDTTEERKRKLRQQQIFAEEGTVKYRRLLFEQKQCEDATKLLYQMEREFAQMERRYHVLIQQKSIFAQRALARIHYIMQEGERETDSLLQLLKVLNDNEPEKQEELLEILGSTSGFTRMYRIVSDASLYQKKESVQVPKFESVAVQLETELGVEDFLPKPLYTRQELQQFREANTKDGVFSIQREQIQSVEDLEKLMFLWQEATATREETQEISLGEELKTEQGFVFSQLHMREK